MSYHVHNIVHYYVKVLYKLEIPIWDASGVECTVRVQTGAGHLGCCPVSMGGSVRPGTCDPLPVQGFSSTVLRPSWGWVEPQKKMRPDYFKLWSWQGADRDSQQAHSGFPISWFAESTRHFSTGSGPWSGPWEVQLDSGVSSSLPVSTQRGDPLP